MEKCLNEWNNTFCKRMKEWLKKQGVYAIPLERIIGVLINNEIESSTENIYSGLAIQNGNQYFALFRNDREIENSISILVHEMIHIELEPFFQKREKQVKYRIDDEMKEEIVVLFEHFTMREVFSIEPKDICEEKIVTFRKLLQGGIEEVIARWIYNKHR